MNHKGTAYWLRRALLIYPVSVFRPLLDCSPSLDQLYGVTAKWFFSV